MTTEDDFQAALDANSDDWQTRLVLADWLEERSDPRAEGYRALGHFRLSPFWYAGPTKSAWLFWNCNYYGTLFPPVRDANAIDLAMLPSDWHNLITAGNRQANAVVGFVTRREAEDAAAIAFAKLPAECRTKLLCDD